MGTNRSMPAADVIPVLAYADVPTAVAWLTDALGLRVRLRIGTHRVQLHAGGGAVVATGGGTWASGAEAHASHSIMLRVADVDAAFGRAVAAGARTVAEPQTFPYGERQASVVDPGGHRWTLSQTVADADPAAWGGELVQAD